MAKPARKSSRPSRSGPSAGAPRETTRSARLSSETLVALAPAAEHLLRAVSEVVAAAHAAFEALPLETQARSRWSIRSARAALDLAGGLAVAGAERARRQARQTLKTETAREILAALDERASRLDGSAAAALSAVRSAVAQSLGVDDPSVRGTGRAPARSRPAARRASRARRIPPVHFDAGDE